MSGRVVCFEQGRVSVRAANFHSCSGRGGALPHVTLNTSVKGHWKEGHFEQVSCYLVEDRKAFLKSATESKVLKVCAVRSI